MGLDQPEIFMVNSIYWHGEGKPKRLAARGFRGGNPLTGIAPRPGRTIVVRPAGRETRIDVLLGEPLGAIAPEIYGHFVLRNIKIFAGRDALARRMA
jgi:hypothetical protein